MHLPLLSPDWDEDWFDEMIFYFVFLSQVVSTYLRLEPNGIKFKRLSEKDSLEVLVGFTLTEDVSGMPAILTLLLRQNDEYGVAPSDMVTQ